MLVHSTSTVWATTKWPNVCLCPCMHITYMCAPCTCACMCTTLHSTYVVCSVTCVYHLIHGTSEWDAFNKNSSCCTFLYISSRRSHSFELSFTTCTKYGTVIHTSIVTCTGTHHQYRYRTCTDTNGCQQQGTLSWIRDHIIKKAGKQGNS